MSKNKGITLDGVSFSREFIESFETEQDFLAAMEDKTYGHVFEGKTREAKLKQLYAQVHTKETKETPVKGGAKK